MKRTVLLAVLTTIGIGCFSQPHFEASIAGADRMTVVKSSIDVPAWHEKSFWSLYDKYLSSHEQVASETYRALNDLAKTDKTTADQEAFEYAKKLMTTRYTELEVRSQYFEEVGSGFNGIIALQFLQTEILLDMIQCSQIYEQTNWRNYKFHPKALNSPQIKSAKYNMIANALALPAEKAEEFYEVYARYEQECDNLLGEDYSIYGLYAGEASDFTPGLAKRLGQNLINVTQREMKLKEKYLLEMNTAVGPSLATRFLAWEDYYSLMSKMYAWSEN